MYASARTDTGAHVSFLIRGAHFSALLGRIANGIILLEAARNRRICGQLPLTASAEMAPRPVRNRLLSKLGSAGYLRLRSSLEEIVLHEDEVLYGLGDKVRHLYFPNDAIVSMLVRVNEGRTVEVAMEGNEGVAGSATYLGGSTACFLSSVRHAGTAMRLPVSALAESTIRHTGLEKLLRRYVHALFLQTAQLGVCNRFHAFDARFARWLLMTRDRTSEPELRSTQTSIAQVFGVRRSTVSEAAGGLLKQDVIDYCRGRIRILDPARLRDAACPCYGIVKRQYDSFLD